MRFLDLFAGRLGWTKAFLARGWKCTAVDLAWPPEVPEGVEFIQCDVMMVTADFVRQFDFCCASSPCEEFSVHGMKHFYPKPKYPENGIRLFNHTRCICEAAGIPYVMENVRTAQQFIGNAAHHCGPFYLWGNAVPPLMPQGIKKGKVCYQLPNALYQALKTDKEKLKRFRIQWLRNNGFLTNRKLKAAEQAMIPPELSNCVADYAETVCASSSHSTSTANTFSTGTTLN